ncbi:putative RNA-directed DNA polymerase, partial [Tanacetum coccineum]
LVNGSPTREFRMERGLRQGNPLSPFLFIIAVEALNVSIHYARNNNLFHSVKVGVDNVHVSHLQFADDALIMGEWSLLNAKNLSRILTCFHLASGLKVNFHKSKLFGIGVTNSKVNSLASTIGCLPSHFPCTYLGLPIGGNMARCANWSILVDKFQKMLSKWKSKSLSFGGRLTLVKSVLGSLGVYYFSTFKAPISIINKLECIRRKFFWGGSSDEKKIAWINWDKATSSISNVGIGTLKSSNQAMLCKWWWRSKSGPWFRIAKLKEDLCKVGIDLPIIFKKKIGNGCDTRFWHDNWLGGSPLKAWRRPIRSGPESDELTALCYLVAQLRLTGDIDLWECIVDDTRIFTVKGMRSHIINTTSSPPTTSSPTRWNNLIPLKVNVFTWKTANQRLPTRSNLDFRGIDLHSVLCPLCEEVTETEEHIFVSCGIAKEIWKGLVDWWNIHRITVTCLTDAINLADMVLLTAAAKMFFDTAVQATLWRFRNETIFASKRPNKRLILDDIKLSSFTWCSSRQKKVPIKIMEVLHETHESPKSAPEDIISSMPDIVTNNILNCLPIQYAVSTLGFKSYKCGEFLAQSPLLETLKLTDNTTDKIKLVEIAKLENLKMLSLTLCELQNMMLITTSSIFQLVRFFPKIQELVLRCSECMVLADAEKIVLPALLCLKTLRLCSLNIRSDIMVSFVTDMICGFPNLETLTINGEYHYNDHVPETSVRSTELNCSKMGQLQLREVLIGSIMGLENEISLIKFILACSPLLKNMLIFTRKVLGGELMFAKKLLKLHRASPVAEIDFHQI